LLPRSVLGRLLHPLIAERRTLAGILAWIGLGITIGFILIAILAPIIAPIGQIAAFTYPVNQPPSPQNLMGTDSAGRDVLSRAVWGARTSLEIMAIGVIIALSVGFPIGLVSGYLGGWIDRIMVLIMDSVYAFPGLLLAAIIAAFIGKGVFNIGVAITVIYVPLYFRVTRNQTLSVKEETYVETARSQGAKQSTKILHYIDQSVVMDINKKYSLRASSATITTTEDRC